MEAYRKIGLSVNNGYFWTLVIMIAIAFSALLTLTITKNYLFFWVILGVSLLHFYFTPIIFGFIHILSISKKYGTLGKQYLLNHFKKLKYGDTPNIDFERDLKL